MKNPQDLRLRRVLTGFMICLMLNSAIYATAQQTQSSQPVQPAPADNAPVPPMPPADPAVFDSPGIDDQLPDSPGAVESAPIAQLQQQQPPNNEQAQQPQPAQQAPAASPAAPPREPLGTAAAETVPTVGVAASKPAGAALAPAKQRRIRTILIRTGALIGAAAAVGVTMALTEGSPSKPPGAH